MSESDLRRLLLSADRQVQARSALRDLLDAAPRTLAYKQWLSRLPPVDGGAEPRAIALLSSFTLETLEPFLQVEAYLSGWRLRSTYVQYGQWQNALLRPATLGGSEPAAVVLLLHDAELLGEDFRMPVAAALARLTALVKAWRGGSAQPLFLGIVQAPVGRHGLAFGDQPGHGRAAQRAEFMRGTTELALGLKNVHFLDLDATAIGVADGFDAADYLTTRSVFAHRALPGVARVLARSLGCQFRPRRKVLVLDLDNTLWGGVVGEDGVAGLMLGQDYPGSAYLHFQRMALELRDTGILLALASKNNEADAMAVFEQRPEMLLRPAHFSAHRINWQDKPANIVAMARQLGLGLDSLVFADDSPIECALVREALPEVEVVELGTEPARFVDKVLRTQAFDVLHISEEDRQRADSYGAEASRQQLRSAVTDLTSFLVDCKLRLVLQPVSASTLDRIHQLMGKTNQFNFTLDRPQQEMLQSLMEQGNCLYGAALTDRFGDYGLIGFIQLQRDGDSLKIANLALSCRALGRGVEDALLAYARDRAVAAGCKRLRVRAARGPRNQQVLAYLDNAGFVRMGDDNHAVEFELPTLSACLPWPPYVAVQFAES